MTEKERNDYFYVCALIEYIARETKNHRGDIVNAIDKSGIEKLLYDAEVNHCLSFEQVSDEVIQYYKITQGEFDTISNCQYSVPSFLDIGKLYSSMDDLEVIPGNVPKVFVYDNQQTYIEEIILGARVKNPEDYVPYIYTQGKKMWKGSEKQIKITQSSIQYR